ncbi:hypothetical protein C8R46DRAFT_1024889 [Mycena filopes]|nr:hypothetical protein C8R46DRAFT_1024889 [Mycena filopes]
MTQDSLSQPRERDEEWSWITEAQINAAEEMRKLSVMQLADHSVLAHLITAIDDIRRNLPLLPVVQQAPLLPSTSARRTSPSTNPSEAGSSAFIRQEKEGPAAKRLRTVAPARDEAEDVHFYDVVDYNSIQASPLPDAQVPELVGEGPDITSVPSSISSSTSDANTMLPHSTLEEAEVTGAEPSSILDPTFPSSANDHSLSPQIAVVRTATPSTNTSNPFNMTRDDNVIYPDLDTTAAPTTIMLAATGHGRYNSDQRALTSVVERLGNEVQSQRRINREQNEETRLMITQARINALEEMRKLSAIQDVDHDILASLLTAVSDIRRDLVALQTELPPPCPSVPPPRPSVPLPRPPVLTPPPSVPTPGPSRAPSPSFLARARLTAAAVDLHNAQRRLDEELDEESDDVCFNDVYFYDVATTGTPREIARATMQMIPHLSEDSFLSAVRVRGQPRTVSIRFRTRPLALTFIDAIEYQPPASLDGLHACWAPSRALPRAIIRGADSSARSDPWSAPGSRVAMIRGEDYSGRAASQ